MDCLLEDKLHKDAGGFLNSEEVAMVIRQPDSSRKMEKIVSMLLSKGDDEFDAFNDWIFFYCKDLIWLHPRYGWYFKVEQHQPPGRPTPPAGQARAQQPTRPPAADSRNSLDPAPRLSSVGAPAGHKQASLEQVGQLKAKL
ncbi:MAG: hypothetical protein OXC07_09005 [Kistimonas sp.]|nr:hypothetical protein [Kistimonas sp.]